MAAHEIFSLADIGANASAEEAEEAVEDQAIKVNNVIHSFRLAPYNVFRDKKDYVVYLKGIYRSSVIVRDYFSAAAIRLLTLLAAIQGT